MSGKATRLQSLEIVRGVAASYIFVHHFVHCSNDLVWLHPYFIFGQSAVMVFLLLSGFVNYYTTLAQKDELDAKSYLFRRFRRIYPPFLIALFLGWVVTCIRDHALATLDLPNLVGNLLMLQDKQHAAVWFTPYLRNTPLWTLCYEWWFYLIFAPVAVLLRQPGQRFWAAAAISAVGIASYLLVPNQFSIIAAYFIMWWMGAELAREYAETGSVTYKGQARPLGVMLVFSVAWVLIGYGDYLATGEVSRSRFPFVQIQHQLSITVMAFAAIAWFKFRFWGLREFLGVFGRVAPFSYALYILHVPVIYLADAIQITVQPFYTLLWVLPLTVALSYIVEVVLQPRIYRLLSLGAKP